MTARNFDAIVIGGGGDALVAAAVLAKSGRNVLHVVRESSAAGISSGIEVAPGFKAGLTLDADWVPPAVGRELGLAATADTDNHVSSVALPDGGFLSLSNQVSQASAAIRQYSPKDAERWPEFARTMRSLSGFLEALYQIPPTDLDTTSLGDLPAMLSLGRSFRSLGKANMSELLRVMPIPVQDLADDWFSFGPLKAAIGAAAVRDIRQGPRSGGTSFVLLHYLTGAREGAIRGRSWKRADAALTAAQRLCNSNGVVTRVDTEVASITVRNDAVSGVVLRGGEEVTAPVVLSTVGATRTLLDLIDPVWLDPELMLAVRNVKYRGCTAMVCYALDGLPDTPELADASSALAGVVSLSGSLDSIEKAYDAAKYARVSETPHIEISVPSLRSAGNAPDGKHVLVAKVHYTPRHLRDGAHWDDARSNALADSVSAAITRVTPKFGDMVRSRLVLTPRDIEERFGLTDGAMTGGEITLDQILFMRPVAGWGQYATPVRGLYLAGAGSHPGPGVFGASGLLAAKRVLADARKSR